MFPTNCVSKKIAFEIRLGFENLEIYTLQALWECYTELLLAMGKHQGHNETIEPQLPGELQFVPQLNPREPLFAFFSLKSASEIVYLLKKVLMNHQEAKNLSRF